MHDGSLMQGGAHGSVQSVLQVQRALPLHDVRKQVAKKRRILSQERGKVQLRLGRDQFCESDLTRGNAGPILGREVTVVRVGAVVANCFEDHPLRLGTPRG